MFINQTEQGFIEGQGFNFSPNYKFEVVVEGNFYVLKQDRCDKKIPKWFFDDTGCISNVTAIVGENGSGKSTLLNIVGMLDRPTNGKIVIDGIEQREMTLDQQAVFRRENIGFIFQSFNLMGTMNAVENVALPLTFQGVDKDIRMRRASKVLDLVGLKEHKKHKPTQMSGGQQQRVGVARALVVNPEIIFADEPTGNLDSNTSREVMELMQKVVKEQQQTLVMVTHDNYLAGFADRIFHIIDGQIVQIEDNRQKKEQSATAE